MAVRKKQMFVSCVILLCGLFAVSFATNSRVESMGKSDNYMMDDISIFTNPANINLYANFLTGELGQLDIGDDSNFDPIRQWFGGAVAYKMKNGSKVTFGGAFNRDDELVSKLAAYSRKKYTVTYSPALLTGMFAYQQNNTQYVTDTSGGQGFDTLRVGDVDDSTVFVYDSAYLDTVNTLVFNKDIVDPVGKTEFFIGYSNGTNFHIGGHFYWAGQDSGDRDAEQLQSSSQVIKGDVGVNFGIGNHALEIAVGLADVSFKSRTPNSFDETVDAFANPESEKSLYIFSRLLMDLPGKGIQLIPLFKYADTKVNVFDETTITGGIGLSKKIEKGLFTAGVTGIQNNTMDSTIETVSGSEINAFSRNDRILRFNFGVEKNIKWDWFTVRVGGQKDVIQRTEEMWYSAGGHDWNRYYVTNPDDDGTVNDVIGFGIGFNFDNKLKVDGTINDAFPYQNPFADIGSTGRRLATRVSATYSF